LAACGDDKVTTYTVPKERDPEMPAAAAAPGPDDGGGTDQGGTAMANSAVPTATGGDLTWQAPGDWTPKPAGPMRKASFAVPGEGGGSELSITAFPGDVGGELANVNRWRGQVGLGILSPARLDSSVSRIEVGALKIAVVDLAPEGDPSGKAILGAIVPFDGATWFFKLTGPASTLKAAKPAFIGFLHTLKTP
jgi:hypothetical protein